MPSLSNRRIVEGGDVFPSFCDLGSLFFELIKFVCIGRPQGRVDDAGNMPGFLLGAASRGRGREADADTAGLRRRHRIGVDHILVDCDSDRSEAVLRFLSGNPVALEHVAKEEMVLRSGNLGPAFLQFVGAGIGILEDSFHVSLEGRVEGFPEGHGLPGDDMLQRASLSIGEDRRIELLVEALVVGKDEPAPGSPEGLVGRRGDDVRVLARVVAESRGRASCSSMRRRILAKSISKG